MVHDHGVYKPLIVNYGSLFNVVIGLQNQTRDLFNLEGLPGLQVKSVQAAIVDHGWPREGTLLNEHNIPAMLKLIAAGGSQVMISVVWVWLEA